MKRFGHPIKTALVAVIVSLAVTGAGYAMDYYVAEDGDDSATGTISEPFATIQHAVDQCLPGDTVYIRGGVYREQIWFTNSGTAEAYITLTAYNNETPIIKGSDIIPDDWIPHPDIETIWMIEDWTNNTQQVFDDGVPLQQIGFPNSKTQSTNYMYAPFGYTYAQMVDDREGYFTADRLEDMTYGTFYVDTNYPNPTLYVWMEDGQTPAGRDLEASVRRHLVSMDVNCHHIALKGLTFRHNNSFARSDGGSSGVWLREYCLIENCDIQWTDATGLSIGTWSVARNCNISNNGKLGLGAGTNFVIQGCTVYSNNYRSFNDGWVAGGMKFIPGNNGIVEGNDVAWNYGKGIWFDLCRTEEPITVRNNFVHDNQSVPDERSESKGPPGIFIELSKNALVYNNIVENNGTGIQLDGSDNCRVYNNTIAGSWKNSALKVSPRSRDLDGDGPGQERGTCTNNQVRNNVFYNNTSSHTLVMPPEIPGEINHAHDNTSDYNCFYSDDGDVRFVYMSPYNFGTYHLAHWAAFTGNDSNSIIANPAFIIGTGTDFLPYPGSPLVDTGEDVSSGVSNDYVNVLRPQGEHFDIGAFETTMQIAGLPPWWAEWRVFDPRLPSADSSAVNVGQLKNIASKAYQEFEDKLQLAGGAGEDIANLVGGFTDAENYAAVNLGQVKNVAKPFYDRLIEIGYADAYPWSSTTTDDEDHAIANIGQVKNVFSFDLSADGDEDGLPYWFEYIIFSWDDQDTIVDEDDVNPEDDFDGEGHSNLMEYLGGTDPIETQHVYYVSTTGNDYNSGFSPREAWASISFAVNRVRSNATVRVLPGTYREFINVTNGTSSVEYPISIEAFDENNKPTVKGSVVVMGWESHTGSIWKKTNWTHNSQQVYVDGSILQQCGWPNERMKNYNFGGCSPTGYLYIPFGFSCGDIDIASGELDIGDPMATMTNGTFYYEAASETLYVWLSDDSSPTDKVVEVSTELTVLTSSAKGLRVKNMRFMHSSSLTVPDGQGRGLVSAGPQSLVENCDIQWGDGYGLLLHSDATALNCNISDNGILGVHFNTATNFLISGCVITNNNWREYTIGHGAGIKIIPNIKIVPPPLVGGIIENCEVAHNLGNGIWLDSCISSQKLVVRNNYVHHNNLRSPRPGDDFKEGVRGIYIEKSANVDVYNNLVVSNGTTGIAFINTWNSRLFNNLVAGTTGSPGRQAHGAAAISVTRQQVDNVVSYGNRVYNNIMYKNNTHQDMIIAPEDGDENVYDNDFNYNCFSGNSVVGNIISYDFLGGSYTDLEQWTFVSGWDADSIQANPLFEPDGSWRLSSASPCIDAGAFMPWMEFETDYFGNPRENGTIDIGPHEYQK